MCSRCFCVVDFARVCLLGWRNFRKTRYGIVRSRYTSVALVGACDLTYSARGDVTCQLILWNVKRFSCNARVNGKQIDSEIDIDAVNFNKWHGLLLFEILSKAWVFIYFNLRNKTNDQIVQIFHEHIFWRFRGYWIFFGENILLIFQKWIKVSLNNIGIVLKLSLVLILNLNFKILNMTNDNWHWNCDNKHKILR